MREPRDRWVDHRGMRLHVTEWGEGQRTVILHHGFLDHGRAWDAVARWLAREFHVLAVDARGHGDSDWVGAGGYYYFQDYTLDLAHVIDALARDDVALVGHSMGGMVVSLYASASSDEVKALVSIEGYGPPDSRFEDAPERLAAWLRVMRRATPVRVRPIDDREEAAQRLLRYNPAMTPEVASHLAHHGTREGNEGLTWKWDPLHKTRGPQPFYLEQAHAMWRSIRCPTLLISGEQSSFRYPESEARECVPGAVRREIAGVGHMIHYEKPLALAKAIGEFLVQLP